MIFVLIWELGCGNKEPIAQTKKPPIDTIQLTKPVEKETHTASETAVSPPSQSVSIGAEQLIQQKIDSWKGKRIGIIANHTSLIDGIHLVDTLLALGLSVEKVFAPEHGFRGAADAGQKIQSSTDPKTGLPILSLYGKTRKPSEEFLSGLDIVVFDIQDIGSRHYTYISTMSYAMEACAEQGKQFVVLDRPNPNGWYVGGPILETEHSSFIGMHAVPIVHGMTVGEYAQMVNEEGWLANGVQADLEVILCTGYRHSMRWEETGLPWIAPSPNIPTEYAAYLYPALCWFEPTIVSVGRGTHEAFTFIGAPWFQRFAQARTNDSYDSFGLGYEPFTFTPVSIPGKSTYPKYQDEECLGIRFTNRVGGEQLFQAGVELLSIMYDEAQKNNPEEAFFTGNFERWAGNTMLEDQIKSGEEVASVFASWQEGLAAFRQMRKKYLMYE